MLKSIAYSQPKFRNPFLEKTRKKPVQLAAFWLAVGGCLLLAPFAIQTSSLETLVSAGLIFFAAILPSYLWCSGRALGLPIFPIFALTYCWTYALTLVNGHPGVALYSPESHLNASLAVSGFLSLATLIWYQFVGRSSKPPKYLYVFRRGKGETYLLYGFVIGVLYSIAILGGWLDVNVGLFSLIRGVVLGLNNLAVFVLAYRWGTKELPRRQTAIFGLLCVVFVLVNAATFLLINALAMIGLGLIAFTLGRRRVPWKILILTFIFIVPLHYGKAEMRNKYWWSGETGVQSSFQPWDYLPLYIEWIGYSYDNLTNADGSSSVQSFSERSSLMQLLLLSQEKTAEGLPHLNGATYAIIPQLLIPRFLYIDKPASHEGTFLLNIHYGVQTREDTFTTTIGWGLLNEAYANFGLYGCAGLALLIGSMYGIATRWSMHAPVLSARYLFVILLVSSAFQTEFSASVFVTALFQSTMPLLAITFLFMKVQRVKES